VAESLVSKCEALSSNPSITKCQPPNQTDKQNNNTLLEEIKKMWNQALGNDEAKAGTGIH
jgi:hypothetical protein